jgi:membrane protein DedA with SNARE-associated domain
MHILLELDLSLYLLLFFVAGSSGLLVRIDQWVEGDFKHPRTDSGKLDIFRSFWSYILIFILSGLAGTIVAVGTGYLLENRDSNILLFVAVMIGAIGKLIFYKLVEWVHSKFDDNVKLANKTRRRR